KGGRTTADAGGLRATPETQLTYRVRGQGQFKPIEKFIASAQTHLLERYEHYTRLCHNTADTAWEKRWYEQMCDDITATLWTLASPHIGRAALSETSTKCTAARRIIRWIWHGMHKGCGSLRISSFARSRSRVSSRWYNCRPRLHSVASQAEAIRSS